MGLNENKGVGIERAYQISEVIIVFIGFGMMFLSIITSLFSLTLPREFLFGATLASFLLAFADGVLIKERLNKLDMWQYGILFVSGILSIIYAPILLQMFPQWLDFLEPLSENLTLLTLGFVLMVLGYRAVSHKGKAAEDYRLKVQEVQTRFEFLDSQIMEVKKESELLRKTLNEKNEEVLLYKSQLKELEKGKD